MAEEISFTGSSQNCCVCFIDIVESTRITSTIEITYPQKIRRYYSIFINTMAALARDFDAKIIAKAEPNGMVIGNNLYQLTKTAFGADYYFNKIGEYPIDNSDNHHQYSVYSIASKDRSSNDKKLKL